MPLTQEENDKFKQAVVQRALPVGGALIICAIRDVFKIVDMFTIQKPIEREVISDGSGDYAKGEERKEETESVDAGIIQESDPVDLESKAEISELPS